MTNTVYNVQTNKQNHRLSILLSLWVYIYAFFYFIPLIIPSNSYLMYVVLLCMTVLIIMNAPKLKMSLFMFVCCYITVALINVVVVSYKYYAAVDAFSGLAVFLPALLVVGSDRFDLLDFTSTWSKMAQWATIFSPIAVILLQARQIDYGVFTYLNLPNAVIFSYMAIIATDKKQRRNYYLLSFVNFGIILLFGGRMAALAAAFSIFLSYMLSIKTKTWKKISIVIIAAVAVLLTISYLEEILLIIKFVLDRYNLSSRSVALLLEQIKNGNAEIYLSGRNIIYDEMIDYISNRSGLPGGFGISLAVSNGKYYHPHNLFLQLSVMIGVLGTIIFFILVFYKLWRHKQASQAEEFKFIILFLMDYFLISLSGGSILTNYVAIIGLGMVFFYRSKRSVNMERSIK